MMMIMINITVITCLFLASVIAQFEGEECTLQTTRREGKCTVLDDCNYAKQLLKSKKWPQHCGFKDRIPIVCCPLPKQSQSQLSEKKCLEYYKQGFGILVFGGQKSLAKEFPHMAILGFGDRNNIVWACGGSLISEEFVLTAAHCTHSRDLGTVRWVRLGDLDIKSTTDDAKPQDFTISRITVHPEYKAPSHYHDVALLKLDRKATFDDYVKPACLNTERSVPTNLIITGWGKVEFLGETSSHLLKADVNLIGHKTCEASYATVSKRKLPRGIVNDFQICAGNENGTDTCPGDSGGPLQFKVSGRPSYYKIVGITSFGKGCGYQDSAGVYVRVSNYLPWIENNVWNE